MEIPAIIFQNVNYHSNPRDQTRYLCLNQSSSSYYRWLKIKLCRKIKDLTAVPEELHQEDFQPQSLSLLHKMTRRELSLALDSQIQSDLKWPLTPYLKKNFPTASSSDPCLSGLDRWWGSKFLLISFVEILNAFCWHYDTGLALWYRYCPWWQHTRQSTQMTVQAHRLSE